MKEKEYKKLPGISAPGIFVYSKLYLAKDHLLRVSNIGFSEDYKRFFFKDIQAITLRKTATAKIISYVLAGLIALLATAAILFSGDGTILYSSIGGFFLIILVINLLRGATCVCTLKTAVQIETLGSLGRLPRARKVLARLQPLIAQAQGGELTPEEASSRMQELAKPPGEENFSAPPIASDMLAFIEPPVEPPPATI
ncbi:hypothetical protein [Pedosphaera parvula]|uniref:hypothetical protein n=1 Tax=Pedosphaera parvula TaxID=1032527 RepID=UPI0012378BAC|nr:hypothetical protein [Pedosphaera parvula]